MLRPETLDTTVVAESSRGSGHFHVLPDDQSLFDVVANRALLEPGRPALSRRTPAGWSDVTYATLHADVLALAGRMLSDGVGHGHRVAVLGRTSYEWVVADYAALSIGAITVPVYPTASDEQVRHMLADSGPSYGFAETPEQAELLTRAATGQWRAPVRLLAEAVAPAAHQIPPGGLPARSRPAVDASDVATIVYTSGTTGMPKGCVLTHRNMFASSANTALHEELLFSPDGAATLLCLPLAHVYGRSLLQACLFAGVRAGLLSGIPELFDALGEFRPTFLALVPYALEKIRKRYRAMDRAVAEQVTADVVREGFGGRCTHVICGGASLDATTEAFFNEAGVKILGAYGLTEAATAVTLNQADASRAGSVGRPIPGTAVGIAADGEVLVSGRNITPGYWPEGARPVAREQAWLHTGDVGRLDSDGYLYITGRRKEILVTSSGKNVSPGRLEDRIRQHGLVSNCMVVGEGRAFVTALITLDTVALERWAAARGMDPGGPPWRELPEVLAEAQAAIDDANRLVSRAESIRAFRILDGDFTVGNGQLTPSLKLRRSVIERTYADIVTGLYG